MASPGTKAQLRKYRSMRDFKKTREPSGSDAMKSAGKLRYLIQKHDATRLHYDFRLEMDGVLKSWAVTRGPSLDPNDKRLAVHVEDHPVEYGGFEGTIPQGEYGGGTVMLWDTGTWEPVGDMRKEYAKGKLHFRLHGKRLQGEWVLLKMRGRAAEEKRENWLLIKVDDTEARAGEGDYALEKYTTSVISKRPMEKIAAGDKVWHSNREEKKVEATPPLKPKPAKTLKTMGFAVPMPKKLELQLATLVDKPPEGEAWVHEIKFDGYRLLARIDKGKVTLLTRANNDWTEKFQSIADQLAKLKVENALIDGEVVAMEEDEKMSFHALQQALSENNQEKMQYYAFDLLYLNGRSLMKEPLLLRKEALQKIIPENFKQVHYSEHFSQSGKSVFQNACSIALEGIVSKRADAIYSQGRGTNWLKVKCTHEQEFVIGGYIEQSKHPGSFGAFLMGYYEEGKLRFAGKVGTGFTQQEGRALLKRLKALKTAKSPFASPVPSHQRRGAQWVEPSLVAQVTFSEWTPAGILRHAVFNGLREDKPPREVGREKEKPVKVAEKSAPRERNIIKKTLPKRSGKNLEMANVTITHPDRVLFEPEGITKADLAAYYEQVGKLILPHAAGRPISLMRCPEGTAETCFFQRHTSPGMPKAIREVDIDKTAREEMYITIETTEGLISLVQMNAIELHVWGAEAEDVERPNRIVLDFDPDPSVPFPEVKKAVLDMRKMLDQLKLKSFVKTTGGKGLHIIIPFAKGPDWPQVKSFSHALCQLLQQQYPDRFTTNMSKAVRKGKIFLDYLRNERSASAVAPYSVRAREGAPVAMPIRWEELAKITSANQFTIKTALLYLKKRKNDPWAEMAKVRQKLPVLQNMQKKQKIA